jgi:hypothetical protein
MLLKRDYNQEKKLDRAWYSSSNIIYSECDDHENDYKTLRVTFKNGACYEYYKVSVQDYLMFMHGGLDGSNGKALNKFVKANQYEYKRIDDSDLTFINEELEKLTKNPENNISDNEKTQETTS